MTSRAKQWVRVLASVLGLVLLVFALVAIVRSAPTLEQLRAVVTRPDWLWVVIALALGACNLLGSSGLFFALLRRHGSINFLQMQALVASSTVLNFVPLRPGLFGRVAYQQIVCAIPMKRSVMSVVEAAIICCVTTAWLGLVAAAMHFVGSSLLAAVLAALPALCGLALAMDARSVQRDYLEAIFWRWCDLIAWCGRYWIVFALLGTDLSLEGAVTAACIGAAANMIPLVGSGLGVREWAIGLAGPVLMSWPTDTGLAAELLNRCIDLVVVVPYGLSVMPKIAREMRGAAGIHAHANHR